MFTQVITRKRNTDGEGKRTYVGLMDRHTNIQRETIIPRQYSVTGYKKYEPKACKLRVSLQSCHIQLYQLPFVRLIPQLVSCFTLSNENGQKV